MTIETLFHLSLLIVTINFFLTLGVLAYMARNEVDHKQKKKPEKLIKPAHEKALQNKFLIGIHLALLFEGFEWEVAFHGLKYTPSKCYPEGLEIFFIFGDWEVNEYDESFIEIQLDKETVNIEKANKFDLYKAIEDFHILKD